MGVGYKIHQYFGLFGSIKVVLETVASMGDLDIGARVGLSGLFEVAVMRPY